MRTRAELDAMSHQELKDYEQSLLALWTPRMAIESDIERLSTNRNELLEIFNQLKNPDAPGVCQHSCHPYLNQATETSLALTRLDRRTGLRAVGSTGEQFLTALPFQRAGFTCFAITSTDSRLARISPSLSV